MGFVTGIEEDHMELKRIEQKLNGFRAGLAARWLTV
jgi:hypothetical protein